MIDQLNILAVATKQVKQVIEATPSVVTSDVVSKVAVPAMGNTSSGSAAISDLISSLPFYVLNFFFFLYLISLWALMVRWVGIDCQRRGITGTRKLYFQALVLIFNFPGLLLYVLLRPALTLEEVRRAEMEEELLTLELEKLRRESSARHSEPFVRHPE